MVDKLLVQTDNAPQAIGTYSQAIKAGDTVYLSGQIPLDPTTGDIIAGNISDQINQVFKNLSAVAEQAGGSLKDIVKLNIYLTNLENFPLVNEAMAKLFNQPYPARATLGVASLPKNVDVEIDAVLVL